ncbi:MAG: class I SAM-dependent methyltransferase [Planctomycetaceae bacterium]|nr:class I SAM-dependent methyltransferase [Planctomycetaceae bacterium]
MTLTRTPEPEVMDTAEEAADYDAMDHREVNRRFVSDLAEFISSQTAGSFADTRELHVLDIGTGTSLIPLELLKARQLHIGTIVAADLSMEMLRLAIRNVESAGESNRILPLYTDAKRLSVADDSCDVVMSNSIVHHIPEPRSVLTEMKRVLRPGGILFVRDLMRPPDTDRVEHFVTAYAGQESPRQQQLFRQSLHAALTVAEMRSLLGSLGLPEFWVRATSDRHWTIAGRL